MSISLWGTKQTLTVQSVVPNGLPTTWCRRHRTNKLGQPPWKWMPAALILFFTVPLVLPSFLEPKRRNILTCSVQTAKHFWSGDAVGGWKLPSPFVGYAENNEAALPSDADGKSHLNHSAPQDRIRTRLPQKTKTKKWNPHLQLTNDYPWSLSPSSTYSTGERQNGAGCAWSFSAYPLLLLLLKTILLSPAAGLGAHNL